MIFAPELRASITNSGAHPSTFLSFLGGDRSYSGVDVTESNALTYGAFYGCVRVLSEDVAAMPLKLYRREGESRERVREDPRDFMLHSEPNPETSSFIWREAGMGHLLTWGNHYAEIERDKSGEHGGLGRPIGLWQRRPDRVRVERVAGKLTYFITNEDGREVAVDWRNMFHVPGLSFNGLVGFSPVRMAREAIAMGMATQRFGASFFGNSAIPGLVIKRPAGLKALESKDALDRLRGEIEEVHRGVDRSHRVAILQEGAEIEKLTIPPEDAQFLETRRFQLQEMARIHRIPLHLLMDEERATFNNIEHQGIKYVSHTLLGWMTRWEAEANRKLLTREERMGGMFFKFTPDVFLRGDVKARYEAYASAIQAGWLTPNEARGKDDMNPLDGLDKPLQPLNMTPAGEKPAPPPETDEGREARTAVEPDAERRSSLEARWRLRDAFASLIADAAERVVGREAQDVKRELKRIESKGADDFLLWLGGFYEKHRAFIVTAFGPVLRAYMKAIGEAARAEVELSEGDAAEAVERFVAEYLDKFGERLAGSHENQIKKLLRDADNDTVAIESILDRLAGWQESAPGKIGSQEATQAAAAMSTVIYQAAGIATLVWVANSGHCPICAEMNGRTVETGRPFLRQGDKVEPGDENTNTLEVKQTLSHPPLHKGCNCSVAPG